MEGNNLAKASVQTSFATARPFVGGKVDLNQAINLLPWFLENLGATVEEVYGEISDNDHSNVLRFIFKPGLVMSPTEELVLLAYVDYFLHPERTYVCCNRAWQAGPNWECFLWIEGCPAGTLPLLREMIKRIGAN